MKFTAVTLACLATGIYARASDPPTKVYERDIATVTGAIEDVGKDIDGLGSALQGFKSDPQPVKDAADKLIGTLGDSKSKVDGSDKLTLADALGLQEPVKALQTKSEELVKGLKGGKTRIQDGGYCKLVREKVNSIDKGSNDLIDSVVSKVPESAQDIAKSLASGLQKVLAEAKTEFNEQNCKDSAGGGKSSAPASSAPASSAPASSAPASSAEPSESEPAATSAPASSGYAVPSESESESEPASTSAPANTGYPKPSGPATTPYQPTGTGIPTAVPTTQAPIVTAGAALVAPAGALAMAVAAMIL
ncbi:hypothetical protein CDD83_6886 [Cordyceps sp. RAO-2017]|nr:hypothetical protein CDD83_6886 [Cordyceps sp. RAO-2017]